MLSSQIYREPPNSVSDSVEGLIERKNQGVTFGDANFIQSYLQKQACVFVHFYACNVWRELVALFQREGDAREPDPPISDPLIHDWWKAVDSRDPAPSCYEEIVLVDVIKAMKPPEFIVPSLVWVGIPNNLYDFLPDALYLSAKSSFVGRGGRRMIEDWEGVPIDSFPIGAHQSANEIVQRRTEVLKYIPSEQTNLWRNGISLDDMNKWIATLKVVLYPQAVGVFPKESSEFNFELLDSLCGPLDL